MENEFLVEFGKRLNELRKRKDLTQQNMADIMGITMRNYQRYEYGKINVPATTLNFFADFFNVTTDYLLGREKEKRNEP